MATRTVTSDPDSRQPRENPVRCQAPGCRRTTWNVDAVCDDHDDNGPVAA